MKRKLVMFGTVLVLGAGSLIGGAAPAAAQPALGICREPTVGIVCSAVDRQIEHVEQEIANVPGYIDTVRGTVLNVYDNVTARVRCIISGDCPE